MFEIPTFFKIHICIIWHSNKSTFSADSYGTINVSYNSMIIIVWGYFPLPITTYHHLPPLTTTYHQCFHKKMTFIKIKTMISVYLFFIKGAGGGDVVTSSMLFIKKMTFRKNKKKIVYTFVLSKAPAADIVLPVS